MLRIHFIKSLGLLAAFIAVVGCSFGQTQTKYELTEMNDIDYFEGKSIDTIQRLNLVVPKGIKDSPLLVWIGGGAWSYVDRHVEMDLARKFATEESPLRASGID